MNRQVVIIHDNDKYTSNVKDTVNLLISCGAVRNIVVYTRTPMPEFNMSGGDCTCVNEIIPADRDTDPKIRNWINSTYAGLNGFLHVISGSVQLLKDPSAFMADVENMMRALDYPLWLNTCCDGCNFIYSKYNPRMHINCDNPECVKLGLSTGLNFTSHSNTQWVCYDMPALVGSDLVRFDERFTVAMFFIIELLARRRNTKPAGSLFFMNQYLTVGSEYGTFKNLDGSEKSQPDQKAIQEEDAVFKQMNVNFTPDNNVDMVLETLWEKVREKARLIV